MFEQERFVPAGATIRKGVVALLRYDGQLWLMPADRSENGSKREVVGIAHKDDYLPVFLLNDKPGHSDLEFPGGAVEEGETVEDALERELREELLENLLRRAEENGLSTIEKKLLSAHFDDVFSEIIRDGLFKEFEDLLVKQSTLNQETGVETLRAIYTLQAAVVELTEEQFILLRHYSVLVSLSEAEELGLQLRPYLKVLAMMEDESGAKYLGV